MGGMRGSRARIPAQTAFSEHGLPYFDPNAVQGHALGGLPAAHKSGPQSHHIGKASDTGSPPPHSATTSGSTSTPNSPSTGGLSSSVDGPMKHHEAGFPSRSLSDGSPAAHLEHVDHQGHSEGNWPVSVSDGLAPQQYPSSPAPVAPASHEHNLSQST
jgi:hypothetical protein